MRRQVLVRDSAENCGGSAVALIDKVDDVLVVQVVVWFSRTVKVPQIPFIELTEDIPVSSRSSTSLSWRRGSFPWSKLFSRPLRIAFLQLQFIDKVVHVCCAGPAVLECRCGGDSRAPTVAAR